MATSKCGHCKSATFEVKEVEPRESRFKLIFVQCASCGVPVGVIDYMNIGDMLSKLLETTQKQSEAINDIARSVGVHNRL